MSDAQPRCPTCRQRLGSYEITDTKGAADAPENSPRSLAESNLKRQVELLDQLRQQMGSLLEILQTGELTSQQILTELQGLHQGIEPMHGLCIDRSCALCRLQEQVIKEHVMLYIDWKVPGTISKLEQVQRRN